MNLATEIAFAVGAFLLNPWTLGAACVTLIVSGYRQWKRPGQPGPGP